MRVCNFTGHQLCRANTMGTCTFQVRKLNRICIRQWPKRMIKSTDVYRQTGQDMCIWCDTCWLIIHDYLSEECRRGHMSFLGNESDWTESVNVCMVNAEHSTGSGSQHGRKKSSEILTFSPKSVIVLRHTNYSTSAWEAQQIYLPVARVPLHMRCCLCPLWHWLPLAQSDPQHSAPEISLPASIGLWVTRFSAVLPKIFSIQS